MKTRDTFDSDSTRVLMLPAGQDLARNPYTHLLVTALRAARVEVRSANRVANTCKRADIVHVHWPHNYASVPKGMRAFIDTAKLIALCLYHRLFQAHIVWTVHDLKSLTTRNRRLEDGLMAIFTRLTGGLIFLNRTSREELYKVRPYMAKRASLTVPHGIYGDIYPPPQLQGDAQQNLGLRSDKPLMAFVGSIKPYKNLDELLEAVSNVPAASLTLVVAGKCDPASDEASVSRLIDEAQRQRADVRWLNRHLSDAELVQVIDAADIVALPYKRTWNSGMAILVLERGKRLLCSDSAVFRELAEELGDYWITLADPDLESATSRALGKRERAEDRAALRRFIARRQWTEIGRQTADFYKRLGAPARASGNQEIDVHEH